MIRQFWLKPMQEYILYPPAKAGGNSKAGANSNQESNSKTEDKIKQKKTQDERIVKNK
ncbi:MAG: hypothetical protein ABJB11_08255 [Ferruginibacter sp.]